MIQKNPFSSPTFKKIWLGHFNDSKQPYTFSVLEISFYKPRFLPIYINVGKNLTKGLSYQLDHKASLGDFKNKVALIYDVPAYFSLNTASPPELGFKSIKQYPGFLIHLDHYSDFKSYLTKTFSKSSLQKLNRYQKRLELCFDIKEKIWMGAVDKSEYDFIFNHFKRLLTKRFEDKQITNNNLHPEEWSFYYEVVYALMQENKAFMHVIYNGDIPISLRLLYVSETIIFDAITVFDIDYTKFHIGKISIMKMLAWSFQSPYKIFDFSKGYFDYKESWSDLKYDFNYHIYYDKTSLTARTLAQLAAFALKAKQYLRDQQINDKLHKVTFVLKRKSNQKQVHIEVLNANEINLDPTTFVCVDLNETVAFLKRPAYDFLFLNSLHLKDLKIYKLAHERRQLFLLKGPSNEQILEVKNHI